MSIQSETKKEQDKAYNEGKKMRERLENNETGSPKNDGYADKTDEEKEAYKKGYRGD